MLAQGKTYPRQVRLLSKLMTQLLGFWKHSDILVFIPIDPDAPGKPESY